MSGFGRDELLDRLCRSVDELAARQERLAARCEVVASALGLDPAEFFTPVDTSLRDIRWHVEAVRAAEAWEAEEPKRRAAIEEADRRAENEEWRRIARAHDEMILQLRALPANDERRKYLYGPRPL
jgi:hypothetical protein